MVCDINKDEFPLVSILIPAYNQIKYLKIALESAINQTYKNTEIIVCDDSTTKDVQNLVEEYMRSCDKIKYYNNGGPLGRGGGRNVEKCFQMAKGEYISFLFHDDEYYPCKIEKMMEVFRENPYISLVSSSRTCINCEGQIIKRVDYQYEQDMDINGVDASRNILSSFYNFIGEFTTVMFKKSDVLELGCRLNTYFQSEIKCLTDISLFLKLCSKGRLFFFKDPLSKFRLHEQSNTNDKSMLYYCPIDFLNIILDSYENGLYIYNEEELIKLLNRWKTVYASILVSAMDQFKLDKEYEGEYENFVKRIEKYNIEI